MMVSIRSLALTGLIAVGACTPALAAPATVDLRVEGSAQTLYEDGVTTDGRDVTTPSGGTHKCDGTNGGANPTAGPTMTTALDDGAQAAGFSWDGTYDSGFDDFLINRIGPDTNTGAPAYQPYWGLFLDWVATSTGGCQTRVAAGDDVLFAYSSFGQPLLELSAPARAATGQEFEVEVRQHNGSGADAPAAGASVQGRTTGADGSATISFEAAGTKRFKATRSDAVRSNAAEVCVYEPGSGDCGTAKAGPGPVTTAPGSEEPAGDSTPPLARISSIDEGRRYRRRGPRLLAGEVDEDGGLDQVMFRLRRVAHGTCSWFTDKHDRFARARSCRRAKHVRVGDDPEWSYLLPERLERGRYLLQVRAVDDAGNVGREQIRFYVVGGPPAATTASAPRVEQMVVFRDGTTRTDAVRAARTRVRVHGRRCAVAAATPLAALVRAHVARLRFRDYGSCSRRAADGTGLFVRAIGPDRNRGDDGWVYKVGSRLGTAGAADPAGPFGHGRLRARQRVVWFYCVYDQREDSCQRTLSLRLHADPGGQVVARARVYDDHGRAQPAAGATVVVGPARATADADGVARLTVAAGTHAAHAELPGAIRSFPREVTVE